MNLTVSVGMDAEGRRVPRVLASATSVAEVVHACHERTIDVALARAGDPRARPSERSSRSSPTAPSWRCEADAATCPGCKRRTEALGIHSLDDFIARHKEIVVGDGAVRLVGQGRRHAAHAGARCAGEDVVGRELLVLGAARAAQAAPRHSPRQYPGPRVRRRGRDAIGHADGAAATRQYRHGGARHGQLRARRPAPHRAARRLAEREGAHRRVRRQLHHRRRRAPSRRSMRRSPTATGWPPPRRASATCASRS